VWCYTLKPGRGRRLLDHTSDVYVEAYGEDLKQAFEEAGVALFETLVRNLDAVLPAEKREVVAGGYDLYSLLYDWLEKLLLLFEIDGFVGRRIDVMELVEGGGPAVSLSAVVWGEFFDKSRHKPGIHVKSPTYWLMEVVRGEGRSLVRFVLDI